MALAQIAPLAGNGPALNLDAAINATFGDEDADGDLFLGNGSGEQEELAADVICWIPDFGQMIPHLSLPIHDCINAAAKTLALKYITAYNYYMLINGGFSWSNNLDLCAKIAYMRALIVSKGVSDHTALAATKNCIYSLFQRGPYSLSAILLANPTVIQACVTATNQANARAVNGQVATAANLTFDEVNDYLNRGNQVNPAESTVFKVLDNASAAHLRKIFVDLACIVAWYFRATGHHYNQDADERIGRVWKGCIHADQQTDCGMQWIHVCRHIFKCVFPIDLENFWNAQAEQFHCSRPLILRLSTFPAGSAAYGAVIKGYDDITTVFPMFEQRFADVSRAIVGVKNIMSDYNNPLRKMGLSINASYYGQQRIALDESLLSSCAATILACLDSFTERNPLSKSKALQRAGNGAPITGAVIGKALLALSNSDDYNRTLLAIAQ